MKVRAAAWNQGWGRGACEQIEGGNVSSSCPRDGDANRGGIFFFFCVGGVYESIIATVVVDRSVILRSRPYSSYFCSLTRGRGTE